MKSVKNFWPRFTCGMTYFLNWFVALAEIEIWLSLLGPLLDENTFSYHLFIILSSMRTIWYGPILLSFTLNSAWNWWNPYITKWLRSARLEGELEPSCFPFMKFYAWKSLWGHFLISDCTNDTGYSLLYCTVIFTNWCGVRIDLEINSSIQTE